MAVTSLDKGGVLDGRGSDTAVCKKNETKRTNHERIHRKTMPARAASGQTSSRSLPSDQGRVEKLATGRNPDTTKNTQKLTLMKNTLTVGTWNMITLWAAVKLALLRNEMKCFKYDIIGISEVRWTGKGETPNGDFIWSREQTSHMKGVGFLLSTQAKKAITAYNPISSRIISARFDAHQLKYQ